MTVIRLIARPMLASMFLVGGVNALKNASTLGPKAKGVTDRIVPVLQRAAPSVPIPTDPTTLVRINAGVQIAAAAALATGRAPRLSATVLAFSVVPTTYAGHQFWTESDPAVKARQRTEFFKNVSMLGGLLLAGVDTEGKPGVAWRARHAARDARREGKHLAQSARQEAKLVKAKVG